MTPKEVRVWGTRSSAGVVGMARLERARKRLAGERAAEQVDDVATFGPTSDHGVDAELCLSAGFFNLPGTRPTENDREAVPLPTGANRVEHPPRIQRIDRLARGAEDGGSTPAANVDPERIVSRNGDDTRALADELGQLIRVTDRHLIGAELPREDGLEHAKPRRCGAGAARGGYRHVAPSRILLVDDPLHPAGN